MKPYLINRTWVDLDHVLAIDTQVMHWSGHCTLMFHSDSFYILLVDTDRLWDGKESLEQRDSRWEIEARTNWDAFIEAWKARDRKPLTVADIMSDDDMR